MKFFLPLIFFLLTCPVFAQKPLGRYIKDKSSGCRIWDYNYIPGDFAIWKGSCINNYSEGYGTVMWRRNGVEIAKYIGTLKKGRLNGNGRYLLPDNYSIEGVFTNGTLQGKGVINDDGDISTGFFVNNVLQGSGKITFQSGLTLDGHFLDGQFLNLDDPYLKLLKRSSPATYDNERIYLNNVSSNSLYYYTVIPRGVINQTLVLLPSSGESPESVICCNKELIQSASNNHILILILSINNGDVDNDKTTLNFLNNTFKEVVEAYHLSKAKFILAGLSGGGMLALRYTEISRQDSIRTFIIPAAVIGIDPPVDIAGLYNTSKRFVFINDGRANLSEGRLNGLNESKSIINSCNKIYGGSPGQFPKQYVRVSMYSRSEKDGGNAKYLAKVPVRLYCDPDILWQLKERNRDYYDMNAADLSAMINFLILNGNQKAELIPALGKGYRLDGTRHPHSWSIVDPSNCITWIQKI
jgi:pimeloyl-ACP methyl ester carboxylesterase